MKTASDLGTRRDRLTRIMQIKEKPDSLAIGTTDSHLPHRIADAVQHA